MGGNSRALDQNGEVMLWKNQPAFAQKIDLNQVSRRELVSEFISVFRVLNQKYFDKFQEYLWEDFGQVESGSVFNGSSEAFFDLDLTDEEFQTYKPFVGDIDISVPKEHINNLLILLKKLQGKRLTNKLIYVGNNKLGLDVEQINAIFDFDSILIQVDFEASEFENSKPGSWAKFSHSSSWEDTKQGIKGVVHKFMLQAMTSCLTRIPNSVLLTPKSPVFNSKDLEYIRIELDRVTQEFKRTNQKDLKKRITELEKELRRKTPKIPKGAENRPVNRMTFSILYGLRERGQIQKDPTGNIVMVDGKVAIKNLAPEETGYVNDPDKIFEFLFGQKPSIEDRMKFRSFVGLLELIDKYKPETDMIELRNEFIRRLWGIEIENLQALNSPDDLVYAAQALERDSWETDLNIKNQALQKFIQTFPEAKVDEKSMQKILFIYYGNGEAYNRLRSVGRTS